MHDVADKTRPRQDTHVVYADNEPVALAHSTLAEYREALAPGSLLVLSQMTNENPRSDDERQALADLVAYYEETTNPAQLRTTEEFARFFGDWDLLEPGLVYAPAWHPDDDTVFAAQPSESRVIGGVARKPRA